MGHVDRPRLTSVVADNRVTVVEAGAGFGKSALAAECAGVIPGITVTARLEARDADVSLFVSRLRRAFRLAGLSDLAAATQSPLPDAVDNVLAELGQTSEPLLLVVDDVHVADSDELSAVIVDLASSLPAPHRMLILGRNLTGAAQRLRYAHGVASLTAADLAFAPDEVDAVLLAYGETDGGAGAEVTRATHGWPAAVVLAARQLARDTDTHALFAGIAEPHNAVAELVRIVLDGLSAADQAVAVQLAHLPLLSEHITTAATGDPGLWHRLAGAGLPLAVTADGLAELPGPVQDILVERSTIDAAFARRVAEVYADLTEIRAALDVLLLAGDSLRAAQVLATDARRASPPLEFAEIAGIVDALPADAVAEHPRVLLVVARLAGRADRFVHRYAALSRLEALLSESPANRRLSDELHIEIAHDLLRLYRSEEAAERVEGMEERLTPDETQTRANLLAIQGRFACRSGDFDNGVRLLNDATKLALQLGDRDHAAACTYAVATEGLYEMGRLEEALEVAKQSLALSAAPAHRLARINLIADFATDLGRYEEAEAALAEQTELLRRHRSDRWASYVPWGHARIASQRGDVMRLRRAIAEVERSFDEPWFDDTLRTVFLADAADMLGRVGETTRAKQCITDALAHWDGHPCDVIDAMLEARVGDPAQAAKKFSELENTRDRREAWRVLLLQAYAAHRRGDPAAGERAADAFDRAAADGLIDSLVAREGVVAEQLAGIAAEAGSIAATTLLRGALPWSITMLGAFEVRHGGSVVALPPGKPTQAVKLVAALGGRATLDEVVDALWPEQDLEAGRRGVRNVLNRLKPAAPDLLQRDGNDLVLHPTVTIDASHFEKEAAAATKTPAGDPSRTTLARGALIRYHGELLPSDRYEPWSTMPRERARRRFGDLIDLLIGEAEASGEIDEAVRLCERAIEADPYDDTRYVRAARLLVARGRQTHARAVVGRATAMLAELGIEPTGELADLATRLRG